MSGAPLKYLRYAAVGLCGGLAGWMLKPSEPAAHSSAPANTRPVGPVRSPAGQDTTPKALNSGKPTLAQAVARAAILDIPGPADPAFATLMRGIMREPDKQKRLAELQALLEKMNPAQLAAMVPLIRESDLQGTSNGDEWTLLFSEWGRTDGKSAISFVQTYDWTGWDPRAAAEAQSRAMSGWAVSNLAEALAFLENPTGPVNEEGRTLQYSLVRGWATVDPAAAGKWLMERPGGSAPPRDESKLIIEGLGRQGGPEAIESWFAAASAGSTNENAADTFALAITEGKTKYDPQAAAKWLETQSDAAWAKTGSGSAFISTAMAMAETNPQGALEWADRTGQKRAAAGALHIWIGSDMPSASVWLRDHPGHPGYDEGAAILARKLVDEDPEAARHWAGSIRDENVRTQALEQIEARAAESAARSER